MLFKRRNNSGSGNQGSKAQTQGSNNSSKTNPFLKFAGWSTVQIARLSIRRRIKGPKNQAQMAGNTGQASSTTTQPPTTSTTAQQKTPQQTNPVIQPTQRNVNQTFSGWHRVLGIGVKTLKIVGNVTLAVILGATLYGAGYTAWQAIYVGKPLSQIIAHAIKVTPYINTLTAKQLLMVESGMIGAIAGAVSAAFTEGSISKHIGRFVGVGTFASAVSYMWLTGTLTAFSFVGSAAAGAIIGYSTAGVASTTGNVIRYLLSITGDVGMISLTVVKKTLSLIAIVIKKMIKIVKSMRRQKSKPSTTPGSTPTP